MPTDRIILVGAGGHALVVIDALASPDDLADIVVLDENPDYVGQTILGRRIEALAGQTFAAASFHLCIGDNDARQRLTQRLTGEGGKPVSIVHPGAVVSAHAQIEAGAFVAAQTVIAPLATVGGGAIINHGAIVDHECAIGAYSHIAPGASIGGRARVGAGALIGAGARVLPGVSIGDRARIGAGAVVLDNVPAGMVYVGVPARGVR